MKVELSQDTAVQSFLLERKSKHDELVVPLDKWIEYIVNNDRVKPEDIPLHILAGSYVVTEREWFAAIIHELGYLFFAPKRLSKEDGGFWFAEKLEPKRKMPKHDIYSVGFRQPGSFRSKS